MRDRLDHFPTQAALAALWATAGVAASIHYRSSILWVALISVYANVATHWGAHLAWRAKRAAESTEEVAT